MKLVAFILFSLFSVYFAFAAHGLERIPVKVVVKSTRLKQQQVSKSLYAKLKAQALNEARAELAAENEARERAKLEALEELDAGVSDVTEPKPQEPGE